MANGLAFTVRSKSVNYASPWLEFPQLLRPQFKDSRKTSPGFCQFLPRYYPGRQSFASLAVTSSATGSDNGAGASRYPTTSAHAFETRQVLAPQGRWTHCPCVRALVIKPRSNDRHAQLFLESVVGHGAENDVRFFVGRLVNDRCGVVDIIQGHVMTARNVQQDATGAVNRDILQ